jgi:hypothetical protein
MRNASIEDQMNGNSSSHGKEVIIVGMDGQRKVRDLPIQDMALFDRYLVDE